MATNNDEYLDKLEPKSQTIFQDFMQTYSPKSWFQLRTAICTIIVETNIYDFSELTYSDYAIFFSNTSKKTTGNKYSIIKQFFKYLYCKNIIETKNPVFTVLKRQRCRNAQEVNDISTPFYTPFRPVVRYSNYQGCFLRLNPGWGQETNIDPDN